MSSGPGVGQLSGQGVGQAPGVEQTFWDKVRGVKGGKASPAYRLYFWGYIWILVGGGALIVGLSGAVLKLGKPLDTTSTLAAAGVLSLAPGIAVGIERALEAFWTLVDRLTSNSNWPFSAEAKIVSQFASKLSTDVKAPLEVADKVLRGTDQLAIDINNDRPSLQTQVQGLLQAVNSILLGQDPTIWPDLQVLKGGLQDVDAALGGRVAGAGLNLGVAVLDTMSGWVDTLVTNPGRKLLSLLAGSLLGLGASWLLRLDLVHAALGGTAAAPGWYWGTVVTGLAIGLGSNPTHELIKAIQAYKQKAQ